MTNPYLRALLLGAAITLPTAASAWTLIICGVMTTGVIGTTPGLTDPPIHAGWASGDTANGEYPGQLSGDCDEEWLTVQFAQAEWDGTEWEAEVGIVAYDDLTEKTASCDVYGDTTLLDTIDFEFVEG